MPVTLPASEPLRRATHRPAAQIRTNFAPYHLRTVPTIPKHLYASQLVLHPVDGVFCLGLGGEGEVGRDGYVG
jgi:hypothetical protein